MEINPKYKNKAWSPQSFIGYSERHGLTGEPATTDVLPAMVEEMRAQQRAKVEQERLLGVADQGPTEAEMMQNRKQMIQKMSGLPAYNPKIVKELGLQIKNGYPVLDPSDEALLEEALNAEEGQPISRRSQMLYDLFEE